MLKKSLLTLSLFGATVANADVLTTLKPLGFISAAITEGVTHTQVLLPVTASPHDYSLKPSDIEKLNQADLVVWIGDEMETFLEKAVEKLPKEKVLTLEKIAAIEEFVEKAAKEDEEDHHDAHKEKHKHDHKHNHKHDAHDHHHDHDWHIWLSPEMATVIAEQLAERLTEKMPEQADKIQQNLAKFQTNLTAKHNEITQQLAGVKGKGYYTFHDAYGYFENAYGLSPLGSFTINPSIAPGAKTLQKIKKNLTEHKAQCLFTEPQFTPKVVESLSKNTNAKVDQLDPLGGEIEVSAEAYPTFLQNLADSFYRCLSK